MGRNFWEGNRPGFVVVILKTPEGENKIKFSDYESFYKILTPQRVEIMALLAKEQVKSINELSRILGRDNKNVRNDLSTLEAAGFVKVKQYRNRKVPEVVSKAIRISIDLEKISPFSEKKRLTKDKLNHGVQMLRQKYLPTNPIVSPDSEQVERC